MNDLGSSVADAESGELLISNHSDANVGSYACEARNSVGSARCTYALRAYNRKSESFPPEQFLLILSSSNIYPAHPRVNASALSI